MKKRLSLVLLSALLVGSPAAVRAQTSKGTLPRKGDAEQAAERAELERKALSLLGEALAASRELKLVENRVRAQVTAARLLWPRNAAAGREAFKAAADGIAGMSAGVDPEDPQFYSAAQTVMQFRGELLQIAAQFDAGLALEFLRATRPPYADALVAAGYGQQEQALELNLASRFAAQEPRRAFEMAEESLSRGVTTGLLNVLNELRTKEPASAARLAADIVRRLRVEDMWSSYEASGVAQQLLALTRPADATPGGASGQVVAYVGERPVKQGEGAALLDEQTRRELVEKILAAVTGSAPNQSGAYNLFQALQTLLPEVERYAPGRAAALRRRADELERGFNPQGRLLRPYEELMQTGAIDALLDAASKAPAEVRDHLYMHAAWKAFNEGKDPERARQILESVANPQQRAQTRRNMELQAQMNAAQQGGYAEARQSAARLSSLDERMTVLMQIATQAVGAGDKQTARQVLEEVRALAETQTRGHQQFHYRLQVAEVYTRFDTAAAFEVVESAIFRLDELIDAALVLDGFGQDAFREGELRPQGGYLWTDLINRCAMTLAALAPTDFERASADAAKFRRLDARTTAQLMLAATVLDREAPVQGRQYEILLPLRRYNRGG